MVYKFVDTSEDPRPIVRPTIMTGWDPQIGIGYKDCIDTEYLIDDGRWYTIRDLQTWFDGHMSNNWPRGMEKLAASTKSRKFLLYTYISYNYKCPQDAKTILTGLLAQGRRYHNLGCVSVLGLPYQTPLTSKTT